MRPTDRFRHLGPGWDSYGARPPDPATCDLADRLVAVLVEAGLPAPRVGPLPSGGVVLDWGETGPVQGEIDLRPVSAEVVRPGPVGPPRLVVPIVRITTSVRRPVVLDDEDQS